MAWLVNDQGIAPDSSLLACFPGDVPWFPENIVACLRALLEKDQSQLALVDTEGQLQPLFSTWRLSLLPVLEQAINEGLHGPKLVLPRIKHSILKINRNHAGDFLNINTPEDLRFAQKLNRQT